MAQIGGKRDQIWLPEHLTGLFIQGQADASWELRVLCSANNEDDFLFLNVSNIVLFWRRSPEEQMTYCRASLGLWKLSVARKVRMRAWI